MAQDKTEMKPLTTPGKIRPNDVVTVYSLEGDKYYKNGDAVEMHPTLAAKLVEAKKFSYEAPKEKGGK